MKTTFQLIAFATLLSTAVTASGADATPEERGREVAQKAKDQDADYGDMTADMKMTLTNRHGQKSTREIRSRNLEVKGDGDKLMSIFDTPRDVKGTAFLSFTHREGPDDQWLYLPALKRVKRITTNNKSGPFMGSEFAYEDLLSQEVEKFTYKYIKEDTVNGRKAHVVERSGLRTLRVHPASGLVRQRAQLPPQGRFLRPEKRASQDAHIHRSKSLPRPVLPPRPNAHEKSSDRKRNPPRMDQLQIPYGLNRAGL